MGFGGLWWDLVGLRVAALRWDSSGKVRIGDERGSGILGKLYHEVWKMQTRDRHAVLASLLLDTGGQLGFCEGRVARARRYGARALILGRSLRTPSQKPNCSAGSLARSARGVGRQRMRRSIRCGGSRLRAGQAHTPTTLASEAAD